ncbi:hypothetical protein [Verrucomicrobium sp. BvORR106]|uniref:hypothetical protein n=1 Tax=Verrucomicrobium sp. BvORR106 TaxID=1403819 RepID=UPI00056E6D3B|nr:hypothetical protein [Verrucomicrobium sp. BvORR106]
MSQAQKEPTGPFSPFYGCAILIIAICTFGGIVGWTLYSGYRQDKEISQFTIDNAPPLPTPTLSEEQKAALLTKLDSFEDATANGKAVPLLLSVDELNALIVIAGEKEVADYRGIARFTAIDPQAQLLMADLCWQINRLPGSDGPKRFLVGKSGFKPVIENNALDLHMETLTVPGKEVSLGFFLHLKTIPWLNVAKLKPHVKAVLEKVTSFEFSADGSSIILHSTAASGAAPPASPTKATAP